MKIRIALFVLAVAIMAALGLFTQANAGCIEIPTPRKHHEHPYRYDDLDRGHHGTIQHPRRDDTAPDTVNHGAVEHLRHDKIPDTAPDHYDDID